MAFDEEAQRKLERELAGEDVRDAARALLESGEELRALAEVGVAFGDGGPLEDQHPIELTPSPRWDRIWDFCTRTTVRKVVFSVVLAPLFVVSAAESIGPPAILDRMIGGRTCVGPRDSLARRAQQAFSTFGGHATHALVSSRRIVFARKAIGATRFTHVLSVPRADVVAARPCPRGLLRRRVELHFGDGSRIVLAVPSFRHPPARPAQLISALSAGEDQP